MNDEAGLVVPLAGTWIEIKKGLPCSPLSGVVPLAGTWIEIGRKVREKPACRGSSPSRGRGLKFSCIFPLTIHAVSSPSRGRGLKSLLQRSFLEVPQSRPPRGDVD